jgi:hypothetical protein
MLTRLRVELPQMTKKDDKATNDAESANNAHGAGQYRKALYPKHLIDPIQQAASAARAYMYAQTRRMAATDWYYLPNGRIMTYLDQMGKYELAFWQQVTAFLNNWSNVMLEAQQRQGDLFDAKLYPDLASLKNQFVFEYPIQPCPKANDTILSELDTAAREVIIAKVRKDEQEVLGSVVHSAFVDLREQVLRIIKQTTTANVTNAKGEVQEKTGKIYDTLTSDIADLTALLADLDFGGNQDLADVAAEIDTHLTLPATALRGRPDVCQIVNDKAKQILAQMEAFV